MSRLERLVSLLDTGTSNYVRNAAADQLADVQKSHPEELFPLLGRIVPFLRSPKWDTRISAARAIGLIVNNTTWQPGENLGAMHAVEPRVKEEPGAEVKAEVKEEIKEEGKDGATNEVKATVKAEVKDEEDIKPDAPKTEALDHLTFDQLNIEQILAKGTVLLGSGGSEYDASADMAANKQMLMRKLGMQFESEDCLDDLDTDLAPPPPKKKARVRANKKAPAPEPEPEPEPPAPEPVSGGNARMRALAKRKAKFGLKSAPKVHVVDVAPREEDRASNSPVPAASSPAQNGNGSQAVTVEHKQKVLPGSLVAVGDSKCWPFAALCERLEMDMFDASWETRHGALLGLREVIKSAGSTAGMRFDASAETNKRLNDAYLEDLACRLIIVFMLDRFADYVADQVVAPVRESCAQTLGALLLHLPLQPTQKAFRVLAELVLQRNLGLDMPVWAVCHGGMLGLRYLVSVRTDLLTSTPAAFDLLVECVFHGLANHDDDVQAISAATLIPIASEFVEQRASDVPRFLDVIWECLANLKDELSTAIGHVMDLLATLSGYSSVLDVITATATSSDRVFSNLVPRLYPFLRHSITDVRKAVLRSLKTFLDLKGPGTHDWVDLRVFRLVFQNLLLELNEQVADLSLELWDALLLHAPEEVTKNLLANLWPSAFPLLLTPVGSARRFFKMDTSLLIKPSGAPYDAHKAGSAQVNIDGPLLLGDVLIVGPLAMIRNKILGSRALGRCLAMAAIRNSENDAVAQGLAALGDQLASSMSTQRLVAGLTLEEFGKAFKDPKFAAALGAATANEELVASYTEPLLNQLLATMEKQPPIFRDINPVLRAVRTQCQSVFSLLVSNGLPPSAVPQLATTIEGDSNAGESAFGLALAEDMAGPSFDRLRAMLAPDVQVKMAAVLETARTNLHAAIAEAKESLEARTISIRAAAAAAYVALAPSLPQKLNPIIRSLMDSIKQEADPQLHTRIAGTVAQLVEILRHTSRANAGAKIVKNLFSFLCVDASEAPEFAGHETEKSRILSLRKEEGKIEDAAAALKRKHETEMAHIKRKGALLVLENLCRASGSQLMEDMPELAEVVKSLQKGEEGQPLIDHMAVLRAVLPFVDPQVLESIDVLPALDTALRSQYAVVRFVAAKCLATVCAVQPTRGISYLVENILPQVANADDLAARQGAIEAVYHLMLTMSEEVLPYIVFFIVPVMGRMSDADLDVRTVAATTFASIIKLVPLEQGIPDPPGMPAKLLEGREKEREFISQMMDASKVKPFKIPVTIKAELRSYQQEGVNWLAFLNKYHLHGILCDDMGLGKTLQTICMVASDHQMRAEEFKKTKSPDSGHVPSLVVCPTTLTGHWIQEFKKYVPEIKTVAYVGAPQIRSHLIPSLAKADVVVTSYDVARNDVAELSQMSWNYMVLDEGHIIKNATSKLSRAVKMYRANHRLVLSGTPIQNNVLELWSLFDFLMPGFLGTEKSFNERFSKPISASRSAKSSPKDQEAAALALEALHKQVLPFLLRRLKEDVLDDLPPKIIQDYYCDLNETQRKLYESFTHQQKKTVEDELKETESTSNAKKHIFQALMYMRKLCNHPAFVENTKAEVDALTARGALDMTASPKLLALQQLLRDCGIGVDAAGTGSASTLPDAVPEAMGQHRALIFCQQKDMLDLVEKSLLKKHMPTVSYMRLDGSTPGPQRHELVAKFNDDPSIDVLLLTTHVGGLGLNLTGADTVIFVEHDWNPMNDLQAMDRAHRIGQKKVVNVYRLITRGTLEERIMGLQEFKINIASTVINQQNSGLMSMDTDQILDLFSSTDLPDAEEPEKKKEELSNTGTLAKNDVTSGLGELWDEAEYAEEYNLDSFISSLKN